MPTNLCWVVCAALVMANTPLLLAQRVDDPNGVFQLEGNATSEGSVCFKPSTGTGSSITNPDVIAPVPVGGCPQGFTQVTFGTNNDWQSPGSMVATTGIVSDPTNSQSDDGFTGGDSKDIKDVSLWRWKAGKPQAKDDIAHAYAHAYRRSSDNHTILVVGLDRWDNSGAATAGFWFLKDSSVAENNNAGQGADGGFNGSHQDGDLLIVSDFSTGGATASIAVYKWVGNGTSGSLVFQTGISNANATCNPAATSGTMSLCGISNPRTVPTGGWNFLDKSGSTAFLQGEFLEIAVDLNTIFPSGSPCFSTFMAETRASNADNSTLSDFTPPRSFPLCSISATKQCTSATIDPGGTTVTYSFGGQITVQGGAFTSITFSDNPNSCGYQTASVPGTVCTNGSQTISNLVLNQPSPNTASPASPASYSGSFRANFISSTFDNLVKAQGTGPDGSVLTGPANGASWLPIGSSCQPTASGCLQLVKQCSTVVTSGNPLALRIDFGGSITNNANVEVSNITITDSPSAPISIACGTGCTGTANGAFTLAPGGTAKYSGSYTQTGAGIICTPDPSGRCKFTDTVTASGTGALGTGTISSCTPPVTATCSLCPNSTCSGSN